MIVQYKPVISHDITGFFISIIYINMKILFIGGTGNISSAVSKLLVESGQELFMLNRGKRENTISGAKTIIGDVNNESKVRELLKNHV